MEYSSDIVLDNFTDQRIRNYSTALYSTSIALTLLLQLSVQNSPVLVDGKWLFCLFLLLYLISACSDSESKHR